METRYSVERNVLILVALMKEHGVRKVIASPGSTNICFVASVQHDPYFEMYSCVDERSAAYMACGLAAESGEPVALSCTGATASRNYIPGLTEAFYRKLPILAVTSTRPVEEIGQGIAQVMDRTNPLNDIAKLSVYMPVPTSESEEWGCVVSANKALLELRHRGGGPVHINLMTTYNSDLSVRELPSVRTIRRYGLLDAFPEVPDGGVAVYVGAHHRWDVRLTEAVDAFCEAYDAVVLTDLTSNYPGRYGVMANLIMHQEDGEGVGPISLMVHIGEVSGAYMGVRPREVWRVSPDGEVQDTFKTLTAVFEMGEAEFFEIAAREAGRPLGTARYDELSARYRLLRKCATKLADSLPLCNIWAASQSSDAVPRGAVLYLGILNTLRSWTYFGVPVGVECYSNTGGFGIDGGMSALVGSSLASPSRLHLCILGDLSFFYDMNCLGNRHVGPNVRVMVVNNGIGAEFKLRQTLSMRAGLGDDTDTYIAAAGHYSTEVIRAFAESLGYEYVRASTKAEYLEGAKRFFDADTHDKPMVFEVICDPEDDANALVEIKRLEHTAKGDIKRAVKSFLGETRANAVKRAFGKPASLIR